jgi:subtilisin family serine protease
MKTKFPEELDYDDGRKRIIDNTRLLLALRASHSLEEMNDLLKETGFVLEKTFDEEKNRGTGYTMEQIVLQKTFDEEKNKGKEFVMEQINHTDKHFWIRLSSNESIKDENLNRLKEKFEEELDWIGPVYQLLGENGRRGFFCPLPNALLIQPALTLKDTNNNEFSQKLAEYGLKEMTERSKYLRVYRSYIIINTEKENAYQLKDRLENEKQLIHQILFVNMSMVSPWTLIPNDTFIDRQWNVYRIRAGGLGNTAWNLSTGNQNVVICILDTGCDLLHPDLQFVGDGVNVSTISDPVPQKGQEVTVPTFANGHGTNCAGIAAATINNFQGIAGVAGNCRILPVSLGSDILTEQDVAYGISWAADQGARVISMSFGNTAWNHSIIDPAIQYAFSRNVVMCAATGNFNTGISYPASNSMVIACGASDTLDDRQSPSSSILWAPGFPGSNFGSELSVVAPGIFIATTDRLGNEGTNPPPPADGGTDLANQDYTARFFGTSAATPQVAGLAGLIISLHPNIKNTEVRNVIERSAAKVGTVAYTPVPGHPNGLWNQEMGYGRIDARKTMLTLELCIAWKGSGNENLSVMDVFDPSTKKTFGGFTSDNSPSIAKFNGSLWMAWRGESQDKLHVLDVLKTDSVITLDDEYSDNSPSITAFNNSLWIAWKGSDNEELNVMDVFDPSTKKTFGGFTSDNSPSITTFHDELWMAWRGKSQDKLHVVDVFNTSDVITLDNESSDDSPGLSLS